MSSIQKTKRTKHKTKKVTKKVTKKQTKNLISKTKLSREHIISNKLLENYDKTYIITDETNIKERDINFTPLKQILENKYGLTDDKGIIGKNITEMDTYLTNPVFIFFKDTLEDISRKNKLKKLYNIHTFIFNSLNGITNIAYKNLLYFNMLNLNKEFTNKHMSRTIYLKTDTKFQNGIYIARPIEILWGTQIQRGGKDIVIYNDYKGFSKAKQLLKKYKTVIISNYIINPLLFNGLKFHFRTYFIPSIVNGHFKVYYLDICPIYTAKLPYRQKDYYNADIHDTHLKSTAKDYFFTKSKYYFRKDNLDIFHNDLNKENIGNKIDKIDNIDKIDDIWKQIENILHNVSRILSKDVSLYDNIKNGFYIFSADYMLSRNENENTNNVILLEVNHQTGIDFRNETIKLEFDKHLFKLIDETVIEPSITGSFRKSKKSYSYPCVFE